MSIKTILTWNRNRTRWKLAKSTLNIQYESIYSYVTLDLLSILGRRKNSIPGQAGGFSCCIRRRVTLTTFTGTHIFHCIRDRRSAFEAASTIFLDEFGRISYIRSLSETAASYIMSYFIGSRNLRNFLGANFRHRYRRQTRSKDSVLRMQGRKFLQVLQSSKLLSRK